VSRNREGKVDSIFIKMFPFGEEVKAIHEKLGMGSNVAPRHMPLLVCYTITPGPPVSKQTYSLLNSLDTKKFNKILSSDLLLFRRAQ